MRKKGIEPEQKLAKEFIRDLLRESPWYGLTRVSRETGVPLATLYHWVNGRSQNLKTKAYWQAIQKWIKERKA